MGSMASLIDGLKSVYSTVHSGADQRKHQSSASLAFVRGIHRRPVNSPHKWLVTRKMFPYSMMSSWSVQMLHGFFVITWLKGDATWPPPCVTVQHHAITWKSDGWSPMVLRGIIFNANSIKFQMISFMKIILKYVLQVHRHRGPDRKGLNQQNTNKNVHTVFSVYMGSYYKDKTIVGLSYPYNKDPNPYTGSKKTLHIKATHRKGCLSYLKSIQGH